MIKDLWNTYLWLINEWYEKFHVCKIWAGVWVGSLLKLLFPWILVLYSNVIRTCVNQAYYHCYWQIITVLIDWILLVGILDMKFPPNGNKTWIHKWYSVMKIVPPCHISLWNSHLSMKSWELLSSSPINQAARFSHISFLTLRIPVGAFLCCVFVGSQSNYYELLRKLHRLWRI